MSENRTVAFFVPGVPRTQGSKRIVRGRMIEAHAPELKAWRTAVGWAARAAWRCEPVPLEHAVKVVLEFRFPQPKRGARGYPCTGGGLDVEKLVRAVHDAMTGIVWTDDSQVVELVARKGWGEAGVHVVVSI